MMRRWMALALLAVPTLVAVLALSGKSASAPLPSSAAEYSGPRYAEDGRLLRPEGYERWVFVGASLGLSYSEHARPSGSDTFHHVYLDPVAYDHFARTGAFPDPTMLVLEIYRPSDRGEPARQGFFEGDRLAVEVALKDTKRLEDGWAYFDFSDGKTEASPFAKSQCYSCHVEHGADDNVFTQFYPVLRRLKEKRESSGQS